MIELEIIQLIQTAVVEAVSNSILPSLPIQALGRSITPDNSQKYLEIIHIPNNERGTSWDSSKKYRGLIRLVLHWPINNEGDYPALRLINSISEPFDKSLILQAGDVQVKFSEQPDFSGAFTNGQERIFPVTLEYYSFQI